MKKLLLALLLSTPASATDVWVHGGMWSQHWNKPSEKNQDHELLGVEYKNIYAKSFINSYNERVYTVGVHKRDVACNVVCFGYTAGLSKGYKFNNDKAYVVPFVAPTLTYTGDNWGTDITCMPTVVCAINFRIRL